MVLLRIDHLDIINRRLGRDLGDQVLEEVGRRLQHQAGEEEVVAHLGGVRYAVARPSHPKTSPGWWRHFGAAVRAPLPIDGLDLHLTCAEAHVQLHGVTDGRRAVDEAEMAFRRALTTSHHHVPQLIVDQRRTRHQHDDARRLAAALRAGHLAAHYQPIVQLQDMDVVGAEALVRFVGSGPELGTPEDILDLARAVGLEAQITDLILDDACRGFAAGAPDQAGWWVSVNVSGHECTDPTLAHRIARALHRSGLEPHRLVIEVSERVVPDPAVVRSLATIAQLGVRLAIDDFGSGWSTLAQLRSLPIDIVKLDRSLVSGHGSNPPQLATAAIELGRALGLKTLAEGVETGEELLALCLADCDMGQGFWWTQPTTLDDLTWRFGPVANAAR